MKDILSSSKLTRSDKILIILSKDSERPKQPSAIREIGISEGLPEIRKWNISDILNKAKDFVVRLPEGWLLTTKGKDYLTSKGLIKKKRPSITKITHKIRSQLKNISDENTRQFIEESITCFEYDLHRAAVVLSWIGAISVLYNFVLKNKLNDFNNEAKRRNPRWKKVKVYDDFARIKEWEFLDILEAISVIGKNLKQELQNNCLSLRNACGHPNSLKIGENRVAAHLEILIENVFTKF